MHVFAAAVVGDAGSESVEEMDRRFVRAGVRAGCVGGFFDEFDKLDNVVERDIEGRRADESRRLRGLRVVVPSSRIVSGDGKLSGASCTDK